MLKSSSKNTKQNNLLNLLMFVALRGFSFYNAYYCTFNMLKFPLY